MENKKYYYMKLKENFFESESMLLLESVPNGTLYSNILLKMYLKSLKSEGRLMFNEVIPYSPDMIASITRHPVGVVKEALKYFKQLDLIEILDNGTIYMNDIELFIGLSSTEGERKKLARMKLKEQGLIGGQMSDKCPDILSLNSNSLNSISIKSNTNNKKINKKNIFGSLQNVKLTEKEYGSLKEKFPNDYEDKIENLAYYIASKGDKYKDHYMTILNWERKNKKEQKQECSLPEFD
jgi:predicted phage replisome organizer